MNHPPQYTDIPAIRSQITAWHDAHCSVGFVPTMGALHAGHLSLIRASVATCDRTVVSIFVNPTQFGPKEDYASYPRDINTDITLLAPLGIDAVFIPTSDIIYHGNPGTSVYVAEPDLSFKHCGVTRPHFFQGVLSVVLRLFNILTPTKAFFGEKDYQQMVIIKKMVRDLFLPMEIIACPIVRESDGLALSSRNAYLTTEERQDAPMLFGALSNAKNQFQKGETSASTLIAAITQSLQTRATWRVDYCAIVDPNSLAPVDQCYPGTRILIAAYCGTTRLIDNIELI